MLVAKHKFNSENAHLLDSPQREKILPRESILDQIQKFLDLNSKQVADLGAGSGYFTLPLAKRVGEEGKVFAIDISSEMLTRLEKKVKGVNNIQLLVSEEEKIPLPDSCLDLVFTANLFHELQGDATLREVKRVLKPQGIFLVIDWIKEETTHGPRVEHRVAEENVREELLKLGFRFLAKFSPGPEHYGLIFENE